MQDTLVVTRTGVRPSTRPVTGPVTRPGTRPEGHQTRVLVVEDNAGVREAVAEALEDAGLAVAAATGAEAAATLMEEQPFDALVTDIHLDTKFGGLDVAKAWRARFPDRPVVFATAYPRAAVNVGPLGPRDGYLMKPYLPSELLHLIRFVLR